MRDEERVGARYDRAVRTLETYISNTGAGFLGTTGFARRRAFDISYAATGSAQGALMDSVSQDVAGDFRRQEHKLDQRRLAAAAGPIKVEIAAPRGAVVDAHVEGR